MQLLVSGAFIRNDNRTSKQTKMLPIVSMTDRRFCNFVFAMQENGLFRTLRSIQTIDPFMFFIWRNFWEVQNA